MPNYHFNLADHERLEDDEGTMLPDIDAARKQAVLFAAEYLHDHPDLLWDGDRLAIEVTDDAGTLLFSIDISARQPETS